MTAAERFVRVEPEGYVAAPGKPSGVYVTVRDLVGKPVPNAPVTLAVARSRWDEATKKTETTPVGPPQQGTTGSDGRARLTVTPPQAGDLRLTATTRDAGGRTATDEADLWVTSRGVTRASGTVPAATTARPSAAAAAARRRRVPDRSA